MKFKSLIYSSEKPKGNIPYSVFEDIHLDGILPSNVLSVMASLPAYEDIISRQNAFRMLMNGQYDSLLSAGNELKKIKVIFENYNEAGSPQIRNYLFCTLLYHICEFYTHSSSLFDDDGLLGGFSEQFARLCRAQGFAEMKQEVSKVYATLLSGFNLLISNDPLSITEKKESGYLTRILKCAADMGISVDISDIMPRSISPELTDALARLRPELFGELSLLFEKYKDYPDESLLDYADEIDFYLFNCRVAKKAAEIKIPVSFALITDEKIISVTDGYDITLIAKQNDTIIPNDLYFDDKEPFFFLFGANGGGKTTYLRTCAVCAILSLCGCPVPCSQARLCMLNTVLTHFPRDERFDNDGRFFDEQKRVEELLSKASAPSLVLLNETYSTTTRKKASELTLDLAERLCNAGVFGVYVTHQSDCASSDIPVLSCSVDENGDNKRTYKITRMKSSAYSYAADILKKYRLAKHDLEERFGELG